jgi:hypothetical protein
MRGGKRLDSATERISIFVIVAQGHPFQSKKAFLDAQLPPVGIPRIGTGSDEISIARVDATDGFPYTSISLYPARSSFPFSFSGPRSGKDVETGIVRHWGPSKLQHHNLRNEDQS